MTPEMLEACEELLETHTGKAFLGERVVVRGKDLHHDFGQLDWFSYYFYSITERVPTEIEKRLLNFMFVATSYPDPSIWPNHVTALAASARTTPSLSIMAGLSISEASIFGRRPEIRIIDFYYRAEQLLEQGESLEQIIEQEIAQHGTIFGFGRPLATLDERIPHTLKLVEELGLDDSKYLQIALDTYRYLQRTRNLSINIAAIYCALLAHFEITPQQCQLLLSIVFIAGMTPCYLDARQRPEGAFFPVRCSSIDYQGPVKRKW